jgi:hypothetical protein
MIDKLVRRPLSTVCRQLTNVINSSEPTYSFLEVASHLQVTPDRLRQWNRRFAAFLSADAIADPPRYTMPDVAALTTVQQLLAQGLDEEQVSARLRPKRIEPESIDSLALTPQQGQQLANEGGATLSQAVGDLLSTIANSQQTVLNSQNTVREMISVAVQDNFSLKEENRKLRERMLELERALTETQRKEETRRERTENRLRALEGTVSALQQQIAQLVQALQAQRQNNGRRRGWW